MEYGIYTPEQLATIAAANAEAGVDPDCGAFNALTDVIGCRAAIAAIVAAVRSQYIVD